MTKEQIYAIIRLLLSALGSYLLGHNLFGNTIDNSILTQITGCVLGLVSVIWSIAEKNVLTEQIEGAVRQSITFIGGLLVSSGKLSAASLDSWLGILVIILPFILSRLGVAKNKQIDTGIIKVEELKK